MIDECIVKRLFLAKTDKYLLIGIGGLFDR